MNSNPNLNDNVHKTDSEDELCHNGDKISDKYENMNAEIANAERTEELYYKIDDDDLDGMLFSKQATKQILLYEKTVELIGIIGQAEIRSNVMKFTVHNKKDDIIQVLVWNEDIQKIKHTIMPGNILHIDGVFAKHRNEPLSAGNIKYDLNVMSNTQIRLLKEAPTYPPLVSNSPVQVVSIKDSCKFSNTIQVIGYIKNPISETTTPNSKINQGCISDCQHYKLEIRMPIVCDMSEFSLGAHVKITGTTKFAQHPYIWVLQKSDIVFQSEESKSIKDLAKGTYIPKRPLKDSTNEPTDKKKSKSE